MPPVHLHRDPNAQRYQREEGRDLKPRRFHDLKRLRVGDQFTNWLIVH